jgi:hypothetical protein
MSVAESLLAQAVATVRGRRARPQTAAALVAWLWDVLGVRLPARALGSRDAVAVGGTACTAGRGLRADPAVTTGRPHRTPIRFAILLTEVGARSDEAGERLATTRRLRLAPALVPPRPGRLRSHGVHHD